jgi:hypothetical protein
VESRYAIGTPLIDSFKFKIRHRKDERLRTLAGTPTVLKEPLGAYLRKCLFIYFANNSDRSEDDFLTYDFKDHTIRSRGFPSAWWHGFRPREANQELPDGSLRCQWLSIEFWRSINSFPEVLAISPKHAAMPGI